MIYIIKININNKQVNEHYEYLIKLFENQNLDLEVRIDAYKRIQLLESLVRIYEGNEVLNEDDIDDLKIAWGKGIRPILPEEYPKLRENLRKSLEQLRDKKNT